MIILWDIDIYIDYRYRLDIDKYLDIFYIEYRTE
jgi:hypothetical protein